MRQNTNDAHKANILIVDDDPDTCHLLELLFSRKGFRTMVAGSGAEALTRVQDSNPDICVLDVMMPGMDGWETFERVRTFSNIPVLFLTAIASGECAARALTIGVKDYVRKPFSWDELLARIEILLRNAETIQEFSRLGQREQFNRPTVSVVIPTLNEAENLPHVLPRLPYDMIDEVILVDGGSTDDTVEVARKLLPSIKIVNEHRQGKGAALRSGFAAATGDIVITLDADGSTAPEEIPAFIGALRSGADFVKGSRFVQGAHTLDMPFYRKVGNSALVNFANLLFRSHYTDITYGYNATWRRHAKCLALDIDGWACEIISNIRAICYGLRVVEVASIERERIAGQAKLRAFSAGWIILKAILCERFKKHKQVIPEKSPAIEMLVSPISRK